VNLNCSLGSKNYFVSVTTVNNQGTCQLPLRRRKVYVEETLAEQLIRETNQQRQVQPSQAVHQFRPQVPSAVNFIHFQSIHLARETKKTSHSRQGELCREGFGLECLVDTLLLQRNKKLVKKTRNNLFGNVPRATLNLQNVQLPHPAPLRNRLRASTLERPSFQSLYACHKDLYNANTNHSHWTTCRYNLPRKLHHSKP